jgi:hypothetical protein
VSALGYDEARWDAIPRLIDNFSAEEVDDDGQSSGGGAAGDDQAGWDGPGAGKDEGSRCGRPGRGGEGRGEQLS